MWLADFQQRCQSHPVQKDLSFQQMITDTVMHTQTHTHTHKWVTEVNVKPLKLLGENRGENFLGED